jgi:glutamate--cysteine ligase
MRSLDLDLFNPIGIDASKSRFIEALLLTCLLKDSPALSDQDHKINNANQLAVANYGRKPGLELEKDHQKVLLKDWAFEILEVMKPVCAILDQDDAGKPYSSALEQQSRLVQNSDLTASARMLENMTQLQQPFARYALKMSNEHRHYFNGKKPDNATTQQFIDMAELSLAKQKALESKEQIPFDDFLKNYFAQS